MLKQLLVNKEKDLYSTLNDFVSILKLKNYPKVINIELGNSCNIFHIGTVRQIKFANLVKSYLIESLPDDFEVRIIYYESDGLGPLVKSSRGVSIKDMYNKEIIFPFYLNKKIPVFFQDPPKKDNIKKLSESLKSYILGDENLKNNYSKSYLVQKLDFIQKNLIFNDENVNNLVLWFRTINNNILDYFEINQPYWLKNSDVINFYTKKEIIDTYELIKENLNIIPLYYLDKNLRKRIQLKKLQDLNSFLDNKNFNLYPNVILRQALSSKKYPVIRLHGNIYNYQNEVDKITKSMNPSIRLIYNAQIILSQNDYLPNINSIDWLNILLNNKEESILEKIKNTSLFVPLII